jgi:hypothetical protein
MRLNGIKTAIALSLALAGCSAGMDPTQSGDVELGLSSPNSNFVVQNAPVGGNGTDVKDIVSVVVIVKEIDVEVKGKPGKTPVFIGPKSIDLMKLDNTSFASLGITKFPAGEIKEMEIVIDEIGDYVQLKNGTKKPLEVPVNGIVEVECGLHIQPCGAGTIIIDFDPKLKTEDEGSARREYELLPEAKIKTAKMSGSCGGTDGGTMDQGPAPDMTPMCPVCAPGEFCKAGVCVVNPCNGKICAPGEFCDPNDGICHALVSCAGVICAPGQSCVAGMCK